MQLIRLANCSYGGSWTRPVGRLGEFWKGSARHPNGWTMPPKKFLVTAQRLEDLEPGHERTLMRGVAIHRARRIVRRAGRWLERPSHGQRDLPAAKTPFQRPFVP